MCLLYYYKLISTAIFGISFVLYKILSIEISNFHHISKTVKPKNDFLFFFESSCDLEHINIDPESIWIQNAVCRRVRSLWLVILFRVLGGDLCNKEEHLRTRIEYSDCWLEQKWDGFDFRSSIQHIQNIEHIQVFYIFKYSTYSSIQHIQVFNIFKYSTYSSILHIQVFYIFKYSTYLSYN